MITFLLLCVQWTLIIPMVIESQGKELISHFPQSLTPAWCITTTMAQVCRYTLWTRHCLKSTLSARCKLGYTRMAVMSVSVANLYLWLFYHSSKSVIIKVRERVFCFLENSDKISIYRFFSHVLIIFLRIVKITLHNE